MRYFAKHHGFLSLCATMILTGCFSLGRTQPAQEHFVLGADWGSPRGTQPSISSELTIGLRRAQVASYLASSFIVVRHGPNTLELDDFQRWGEPLEAGVIRVVAEALVTHGFREVDVAPWPARGRYDCVIQLDVERFEGLAPEDPDGVDGSVYVLANWEVTRQLDGALLAQGTTDYRREGWSVGDYAGLVMMLEEGLRVVADDLTAALLGLAGEADVPRAH